MKPRSKLGPMVVATLVISTAAPLAPAQVDWPPQGYCVEPGDPGESDADGHTLGDVVFDGAGYTMWYAGLIPGPLAQIAVAVSPDGISRGSYPGNPVMSPTPPRHPVNSIWVMIEDDTIHGWIDHCGVVWDVTSPLEQVFFDHFETGEADIWSAVVPEPGGRSMPSPTGRASEPVVVASPRWRRHGAAGVGTTGSATDRRVGAKPVRETLAAHVLNPGSTQATPAHAPADRHGLPEPAQRAGDGAVGPA